MYRLFFLLFIAHLSFSQELIVNGDFEDYLRCPKVFVIDKNYKIFVGWSSYDDGTPDYYNTCGEGEVKVPHLWAGKQYPHSGNGFAGIYVWGKSAYREYLITTLKKSTIQGSEYKIKISYALANNAPFTCDWLGIRLLDEEGEILRTLDNFEIVSTDPYSGWVTALFRYQGTGKERSLVIGNFHSREDLDIISVPRTYIHPMLKDRTYFFIDDISFSRPVESESFINVVTAIPIELNDVYFDFDKSILKPSSYEQLDQLVLYLESNIKNNIVLTGHTDNIGSEEYNMLLSAARAKSVLNYLASKGIEKERLRAVGMGNLEPLVANNSPEGREANRRVTFTLLSL